MSVRDILMTATQKVTGQAAYTTAGAYSWTCPAGVTSVSVVCVGSGNAVSAGAGALAYKNNIAVVPGTSYNIVVGSSIQGTNSYFINASTVCAGTAISGTPGGAVIAGDGGGAGGNGVVGGGGAGGYVGKGGDGSGGTNQYAQDGAGGGGGGGAYCRKTNATARNGYSGGGGVGIYGQGPNGYGGYGTLGTASASAYGGSGGSYGTDGGAVSVNSGTTTTQRGSAGTFGGSGGTLPANGAVRIIWPGDSRQFPSTNTGDM